MEVLNCVSKEKNVNKTSFMPTADETQTSENEKNIKIKY